MLQKRKSSIRQLMKHVLPRPLVSACETAFQSKKCQFTLSELVLGYAQILSNKKVQINAIL